MSVCGICNNICHSSLFHGARSTNLLMGAAYSCIFNDNHIPNISIHFLPAHPSLSPQVQGSEGCGRGGGRCPSAGCLVLPVCHRCIPSPTSASLAASPSLSSSCLCTSRLAAAPNASETSCCFWDRFTSEESAVRGQFIPPPRICFS